MSLEKDLSKHIQKALNRTISKISKEQAKAIKEEYDLPIKKIRSMSRIKKASMHNLKAQILSLDTRISIKHFKKTPLIEGKKIVGVNVKLSKGNSIALKGHFIAKNRNGGEFIALRENSTHQKSPRFEYQKSNKVYKSYNGNSRLLYPTTTKSFSKIAKEKSEGLLKKANEIFMQELGK